MANTEGLAAVAAAASGAVKAAASEPQLDPEKTGASAEILQVPSADAIRAEERTRIASLQAIELPDAGCQQIIREAIGNGQSPADAALSMVKHLKSTGAVDMAAAMAKGASTVSTLEAGVHEGLESEAKAPSADAPLTERVDHEWQTNAAVRTEFGDDKASYLAFRQGQENGQVRSK